MPSVLLSVASPKFMVYSKTVNDGTIMSSDSLKSETLIGVSVLYLIACS